MLMAEINVRERIHQGFLEAGDSTGCHEPRIHIYKEIYDLTS